MVLAEQGRPRELEALMVSALSPEEVPESAGLRVLVAALQSEVRGQGPADDHPDLGWVLERVLALGVETKAERSERDHLVLGLWPAVGEKATLQRLRAPVSSPGIKRELGTRLPREVPRGGPAA